MRNAPGRMRRALDPHVQESLPPYPLIRGEGGCCRRGVAAQPPAVLAQVARDVVLELRLAIRGLATQAAYEIRRRGGEQGKCLHRVQGH